MRKKSVILSIFIGLILIGSISFGTYFILNNNIEKAVPQARLSHSSAFDPGIQKMVIFGGFHQDLDSMGSFNDTWFYDINNNVWTEITNSVQNPQARSGHKMTYDSVNQKIILFGGFDENFRKLNDLWIFDSVTKQWTEVFPENSPPGRPSFSMYYDSVENKVIIFGGYDDEDHLDDIWAYDYSSNNWTELEPLNNPIGRYGHRMVYVPSIERGICFGGRRSDGTITNEIWSYDYANNSWSEISTTGRPEIRYWHGMVYDSINDEVILFGGRNELSPGGARDDMWVFYPDNNTWTEIFPENHPTNRMEPSMVFDPISEKIILFGGFRFDGITLGDVWSYDRTDNDWTIL